MFADNPTVNQCSMVLEPFYSHQHSSNMIDLVLICSSVRSMLVTELAARFAWEDHFITCRVVHQSVPRPYFLTMMHFAFACRDL